MSTLSVSGLLADDALRRHEFPVCEHKIFLAHAGVSPLPRRVAEAMERYVDQAMRDNQEHVVVDETVTETRALAARLIEARPEEIAFVGSTSMGLAMVAAGLSWASGENMVCYREDYPANVYPWMDLIRRGVEVRFVEPRQFGNVTVEDLERIVDRNTRLVSLASAHFLTGWRLDIDRIGKFLKSRGILFCLDGIQSLGALRTSARWVDFAAADAHKWLLGPLGAAILFVREEHFDRLHPPLVGWNSASCPDFIAQETIAFRRDARRYEPGSLNLAGIIGLRAALQLILELGLEAIESRVLALAQQVIARGTADGFSVVGPSDGAGLSGIVSLTTSQREVAGLQAKLATANIVTSLRSCRDGRRCLRVSAHFYNREEEIAALFDSMRCGREGMKGPRGSSR
ncbi:MAG TPA: aminotransferase class V-fold PLP-dependent enzyme [Verrucomicrobiae bacterium]|nr:aminotransferase class V-fold PLP-dependent enzyme [Verrucomicrobiae bacterium]